MVIFINLTVSLRIFVSIGYGKSTDVGSNFDPMTFVNDLLSVLKLNTPVIIISPSMSGGISLPFITTYPEKVKGYIPVAPVKTAQYSSEFHKVKVHDMYRSTDSVT